MTSSSPIFKVGIITDTHISHTPVSCKKLKAALKLFAAEQVDIMINCGDIANVHDLEAYKLYRRLINEVYASEQKKPEEIFISAYHDWTTPAEAESSFASMKEALQVPHEMQDSLVFKGYNFLIIPQNVPMEKLEEAVAAAVAAAPDKPVFVIDHIPPFGIFHNGKLWGDKRRFDVMKKFPSAIHISGHIHASLFDESNIWQGEFTAVNIGCLATWGGEFAGAVPQAKKAGEAVIMEVFKEKIVFRRISVVNQKEYAPDTPWSVPLPFDEANAPYRTEYRYSACPAPVFPPRGRMKLVTEGSRKGFEFLKVRFPEAAPEVFKYRVILSEKRSDGTFEERALSELPGNFYKAASYRNAPVEMRFPASCFEKGKTYRIAAVPETFHGKWGTPLEAEWKAPAPLAAQVIFESRDPMNELPFLTDPKEGEAVKQSDGFYLPEKYSNRLELPSALWKDLPPGTNVRIVADIHSLQEFENERSWTLIVAQPDPLATFSPRLFLPFGEFCGRYQMEFATKEGFSYSLLLREGCKGKIRFNYLKVEIFQANKK